MLLNLCRDHRYRTQMSHSIRVRAYIAWDRNEISLRRVGDVMVMWLWWFCVLYFQRDIWLADFSDHKSLKTFKLRNALKNFSSKFKINHANNDWTKMFDMIRISKKWLKTDRDCLSIHKLYVFNLICTLHNTTAVRFAIYRYNYPSIFQSNSKCLQSTLTQFWFQQSIGMGSLV